MEQARGIEQIGKAIIRMEQVTQRAARTPKKALPRLSNSTASRLR
jgi:hypothetical protein